MVRLILFLLLIPVNFAIVNAQTASDAGTNDKTRFNIGLTYGHDWEQSVSESYSARFTYEFLKTRHLSLVANGRYALTESSFSEDDLYYSYNPDEINMNGSHSVGQIGLTAFFRTQLFNKPFVGAAILNTDWGAGGFAKVTSIVMGMFMLCYDKDTQFGIGPMFLINTNGKIPALIAFIYRHRFNDKWLMNFSGGLFAMEYSATKKDILSAGLDINANSFYFRPKTDELPTKLKYMSVAFRPMVKYSRNIVDKLNLDVRTGISVNIVNRVNGMTGTEKYIRCHQKKAYPFIQVGTSYTF